MKRTAFVLCLLVFIPVFSITAVADPEPNLEIEVRGAWSGTGSKRAEWLLEIMKSNPNFLIEKPHPPSNFDNIKRFEYDYVLC